MPRVPTLYMGIYKSLPTQRVIDTSNEQSTRTVPLSPRTFTPKCGSILQTVTEWC